MKTKLLTALALSVGLFLSCNKDRDEPEKQAIHFDAHINQQVATSTTGGSLVTNWENSDKIGIFMVNQGTSTITEGHSNRSYTYDGTSFKPDTGNEMFYPVSDARVDFVAYYPHSAGAVLGTAMAISVANQTDLGAIDYLWVKATNGTTGFNKSTGPNVPLNFDHKLCKIVINTLPGAGLTTSTTGWSTMTVTIKGLNTTAVMDLFSGVVSGNAAPVDISPFARTAGAKYEAIVLPETFAAAGAVQFTFAIGSETYTWSSPANEAFAAGLEYTYDITINRVGVTLATVSIKDWVAAPDKTGTAQ